MPKDRFGNQWPDAPASEFCSECGQPDNCGDCDHTPLSPAQIVGLGGVIAGRRTWLVSVETVVQVDAALDYLGAKGQAMEAVRVRLALPWGDFEYPLDFRVVDAEVT